MSHDGRFRVSPHHGDRGWMALDLEVVIDWTEIAELLETAYRHVATRQLVELLDQTLHGDPEPD